MEKLKHIIALLTCIICVNAAKAVLYSPFELNGMFYCITDDEKKTVCVTSPGSGNYEYYTGLVSIPASIQYNGDTYTVTSIEHDAFRAQNKLTGIIFPRTVETIGYQAFTRCGSLKTITFNTNGVLKTIERDAFSYCTGITSINFPRSLERIGKSAFESCTSLESIRGGSSLQTIEKSAFKNCENLVDVVLPNSLKSLGEMAFWTCGKLRTVELGNSLEYIGPDAFLDCNMLENITIPPTVTEIGYEAFRGCWNITSIEIPNSVTTMGYGVFRFCVSLENITLGNSLTSIPNQAFEQTALHSITIPESVKSIGGQAFIECENLSQINFSNGVTVIGPEAFSLCNSLVNVIIPENVKSIGDGAFEKCANLESVTIPNSVTEINNGAFNHCPKLDNVYNLAQIPQDIFGREIFALSSTTGRVNVHVYEGLYDLYTNTLGWYDIGDTEYFSGLNIIADITVVNVSSVEIVGGPIRISEGETLTVKANVSPSNASFKKISWTSSDESVVSIDEFTGFMVGMDVGEATITASATDGSGIVATAKVYVSSQTTEPDPVVEGDYTFTLDSGILRKGETTNLAVELSNVGDVIVAQFDLVAPEGVSYVLNNGEVNATLSDRCDDTHVLTTRMVNGRLRVLVYSSANHSFGGNSGAIVNIPVTVDDATQPRQNVKFRIIKGNITLAGTFADVAAPECEATFEIKPNFTPGDINDDGKFTGADIAYCVELVMGNTPPNAMVEAADVNGDGNITGVDVAAIVELIMTSDAQQRMSARANIAGSALIGLKAIDFNGSTATLAVNGINGAVALQFDVILPEGVSLTDALTTEVAPKHTAVFNKIEDNVYRVLVYSPSNKYIEVGKPAISLAFADYAAGDVIIDNVLVTTKEDNLLSERMYSPLSMNTNSTTGVATLYSLGVTAWGEAGKIVIMSGSDTVLTVSDMSGHSRSVIVTPGRNEMQATSGLYLVNDIKVLVK